MNEKWTILLHSSLHCAVRISSSVESPILVHYLPAIFDRSIPVPFRLSCLLGETLVVLLTNVLFWTRAFIKTGVRVYVTVIM